MRSLAIGCAALAVAASLLAPLRASAYCLTSGCPNGKEGAICTPSLPSDCGKKLFWTEPCLGFSVQKDASNQVDYKTAARILGAAFATWTSAACPGGPPSIRVTDLGPVDCADVEYNQHSGNANILMFRDDVWISHADDVDALARTTVWYDPDTGQINDADIEVNTANFAFSSDGSLAPNAPGPPYDLQAVLTHEAGHFLGLAHTTDANATMLVTVTPLLASA